jgi:hypothetical protein
MTSRFAAFALSTTLFLTFAGCATAPDIHSSGDNSAQFRSAQTFALLPVSIDQSIPPTEAPALTDAAQAGARDALGALSYSETSITNADLVFYLHGKIMAPVSVADWGYLPSPSKFGIESAEVAATTGHRVFVEAYDNHSKRQVWMGWLDCTCRKVKPERLQSEIQQIVETFPPRIKS